MRYGGSDSKRLLQPVSGTRHARGRRLLCCQSRERPTGTGANRQRWIAAHRRRTETEPRKATPETDDRCGRRRGCSACCRCIWHGHALCSAVLALPRLGPAPSAAAFGLLLAAAGRQSSLGTTWKRGASKETGEKEKKASWQPLTVRERALPVRDMASRQKRACVWILLILWGVEPALASEAAARFFILL